jgi:hypothetical protein
MSSNKKTMKVTLLSAHTAENDDGEVETFAAGKVLTLPEKRARSLINSLDAREYDGEEEGINVSDAVDPNEPDENDTEEERMRKEQNRALADTVERTLKAKGKKSKTKKKG